MLTATRLAAESGVWEEQAGRDPGAGSQPHHEGPCGFSGRLGLQAREGHHALLWKGPLWLLDGWGDYSLDSKATEQVVIVQLQLKPVVKGGRDGHSLETTGGGRKRLAKLDK